MPLVIPDDLASWHPNEVADWLNQVETDDARTDEEYAKAHEAVRAALLD